MIYKVYEKNKFLCSVNFTTGIADIHKLPLDLYLESGDEFSSRLLNIQNFAHWCASRVLSPGRTHSKEILNSCGMMQGETDKERMEVALKYSCLSLRDSYWIKTDPDQRWEDINLFNHPLDGDSAKISLCGEPLSVENVMQIAPDCSTDGVAPKAWIRIAGELHLLKGEIPGTDSVRKEVEASRILRSLGIDCVEYKYGKFEEKPVSVSKCFTDPDHGIISYIAYTSNHDFDEDVYKTEFNKMNLADYLVGNTDRHWNNFGFLFKDGEIVGMHPLMDFNHAFESVESTPCLPYFYIHNESISQIQAAAVAVKELGIDVDVLKARLDGIESPYSGYVSEKIDLLAGCIEKFDLRIRSAQSAEEQNEDREYEGR